MATSCGNDQRHGVSDADIVASHAENPSAEVSVRHRKFKNRVLMAASILLQAAIACGRTTEQGHVRSKGESLAPAPIATEIAWLGDLHQPESVKYDAEQDVFFISNMVGFGSAKDANGYIVEVSARDLSQSKVFAENGKGGVVLDAPKGMAIHGDTLWICDIDVMRAINRKTGMSLGNLDLKPLGALLLNDVTIGGDGAMYITDTGILMTDKGVMYRGADKIFRVANGKAEVISQGAGLMRPNGITWDKEANTLVVVTFDPFHSQMYSLSPTGQRRLLAKGNGKFDGIEPLGGGKYMVASWNDSSVRLLGKGENRRIANNVLSPADIGFDTKRNRLAIPLGPLNQMQLWQLPQSIAAR
jgi:sugar lactone lactonase YvrE